MPPGGMIETVHTERLALHRAIISRFMVYMR
jgi:hypothetical protein